MTYNKLIGINKNQSGFTLIEILMVIVIASLITIGVVTAIGQTSNVSVGTDAHMTATKEVENAVHWVTDDAQMVQSVNTTASPSGFPLTLAWVDWNSNSKNVIYGLVNGQLLRRYIVNGGQPVDSVIVGHIDSSQTNCSITSAELTFKITSTIGSSHPVSETRSFSVTPRCAPIAVNVTNPITVAISSLPNGEVGVAYSQTLAATGGISPYTWSISAGALPAGLTLSSGGVISGTPTTVGTSSFTIQVTDSAWQTATQGFIIYISTVTITTTSLPNGTIGVAYNQTLAATGGITPYTWSISSGSLPNGLFLNSSTGAITGTPTTAGTYNFTVKVTDSASCTATQALSIRVGLAITTTSLPNGEVNVAYSQTLAATGGISPYIWSISAGALPAGLALSSGGVISGTPTTVGTSSFTVQVTDSASPTHNTGTQALSITVNSAVTITTTSLPNGEVNVAYSQTLAATGGVTPYTWSISSGSLPNGLSLNSSTGAITGTPTTAGTYSFTVKVTDSASPTPGTATKALSITVNTAVTITTTSLPNGTHGVAYSQTLAATGGVTPYTWSISSGSLPNGLSLNSSTGAITGTPTTAGTYSFTVKVTDSASPTPGTATKTLSIRIY
jgi:prepilin-type N-terminal cleavage/methylation domain-containing protein